MCMAVTHSGFWLLLTVLLRAVSPARLSTQYGSALPKTPRFSSLRARWRVRRRRPGGRAGAAGLACPTLSREW